MSLPNFTKLSLNLSLLKHIFKLLVDLQDLSVAQTKERAISKIFNSSKLVEQNQFRVTYIRIYHLKVLGKQLVVQRIQASLS
jgi:hypothetical protein